MTFVNGIGCVLQVYFFYWWSGFSYNIDKIQGDEILTIPKKNTLYFMLLYSKKKFVYETGSTGEKIGRIMVGICLSLLCLFFYSMWERQWSSFLFYCILWLILKIDWKTMLIPNECIVLLFVFSVITCIIFPDTVMFNRILGFFIVSVPMCIISILTKGSIGGGDIKLMAVAGIFLGWKCSIYAFIYGMFGSGIYGIYLFLWKKQGRKAMFPLGPFLCVGIMLSHCLEYMR